MMMRKAKVELVVERGLSGGMRLRVWRASDHRYHVLIYTQDNRLYDSCWLDDLSELDSAVADALSRIDLVTESWGYLN